MYLKAELAWWKVLTTEDTEGDLNGNNWKVLMWLSKEKLEGENKQSKAAVLNLAAEFQV